MQKYIHKIEDFSELFEKLKYETEKYGAIYSAIMFQIKDKTRLGEFMNFILKYVRITDNVFVFSESKILLILEETTIRGALILSKNLKEKIKEKEFGYEYYCSAIQGDYIETEKKLYKSLKKRLDIAKEEKKFKCVYEL